MRSKSQELKNKIYDFVNAYRREYGYSPSLSRIADKFGMSRTTIYRYLVEMDKEGMIVYTGSSIETKELNSENTLLSACQVVGSIPCGEAEIEEEYVEDYVNLPASIFGKGTFYILRASGDSMVDAGICEGDMVVIEQKTEAEVGDIVVALIDSSENTLKRYSGINKDHKVVLSYMNEDVYPQKEILVDNLVVQGVAKYVIKTLSGIHKTNFNSAR